MDDLRMFLIHAAYALEISIAYIMFVFALPRKKKFPLRAAAGFSVFFAAVLFVPEELFGIYLYISLNTVCVLAVIILGTKFLFKISWKVAIFCGIGVALVQHMAFQMSRLLMTLFIQTAYPSAEMAMPFLGPNSYRLCYFGGYIAVYLFCYFYYLRKNRQFRTVELKSWQLLVLVGVALLIVYIMAEFANNNEQKGLLVYIVPTLICCFALLNVLFITNNNQILKAEEETTRRLLAEEQKHYETMLSGIETINRKCHDLKYQVAALRDAPDEERHVLAGELQRDINIYENLVQTGNAALDNTLSEKCLVCESKQIRLTCNVDGAALSFMDAVDIYALFGNAVDNAIECVSKYHEPAKRSILLRSHRQGNILKIHMENVCTEPLLWESDLPQTSKHDRENHGYGVRSMRYIVQKYGGHLRFSQNLQASLFNTDILFPLK